MAEYYYGNIVILKKHASDPDIEELAKDLQINSEDDKVITYEDEQACDGQFGDLEDELKEKGFPFDRYSSRCCEFQPETRSYRPATESSPEIDITVIEDNYGDTYVPTINLRPLLELSPEECQAKLAELIEKADPTISELKDWA